MDATTSQFQNSHRAATRRSDQSVIQSFSPSMKPHSSASPTSTGSMTSDIHTESYSLGCIDHWLERDDTTDMPAPSSATVPSLDESTAVVEHIQQSLVGRNTLLDTPFGKKAIQYADWTATGRSLQFIESFLRDEVLPHYGNTHTTSSITGLQSTSFREEARQVIAQAVNAKTTGKASEDCVLFTGQGATAAIHKLATALGLTTPLTSSDPNDRPVVFVGPFEHRANILPWRESCAEVIQVPEDAHGKLDVAFLVEKLQLFADRRLKIGSFSAASNLTGVLTNVDLVSAALHVHGALAFWDYASCAPYMAIDMNPIVTGPMRSYVYKDAIFFSGHKFVGGPNTPGVLVCKKRLLGNVVPTAPGGGTVFIVTKNDHRYLSNKVEREEGGTPDIVGSIRLGLAMELKQRVHPANILAIQRHHLHTLRQSLETNPNLVLLGRHDLEKVPIFSFLVRFGDRFLHFAFVCTLLNDLFGIQTRGVSQCENTHATRILGITDDMLFAFESLLEDKQLLLLRAGFTRISFPYFMTDGELAYTLDAFHFVADHGWKFLPQYRFQYETGVWEHHTMLTKSSNSSRRSLSSFSSSKTATSTVEALSDEARSAHQQANLAQARTLAEEITSGKPHAIPAVFDESRGEHYEQLRWFVYPSEALAAIKAGIRPRLSTRTAGPVQPHLYRQNDPRLAYSTGYHVASETSSDVVWWQKLRANNRQRHPINISTAEVLGSCVKTLKHPLRSTNREPVAATPFAPAAGPTNVMDETNSSELLPTPPRELTKWVGCAVANWNMIQPNDRLLVAVSGGKDSLGLLHALLHLQKRSPVKFTIACATVTQQTAVPDPNPLKEFIESLGVPHFLINENLVERAKNTQHQDESRLAYTLRLRRGALDSCCRANNLNKLVLGHHLDDVAESFFLSAMHNGQLRAMRASYWNDHMDVRVIRPLVYVREHVLQQFAIDARLPVVAINNAGLEVSTERERIRSMLSKEESLCPQLFGSLRGMLEPLMCDDEGGVKREREDATAAKKTYASPIKVRDALRHLLHTIAAEKSTNKSSG